MRPEATYSGVQLLMVVRACRLVGVETAPLLVGVTESELEQSALSVPWPQALAYFRAVEPRVSPEKADAMAREFVRIHPLIRTTAQLFVSPLRWLDFFWTVSAQNAAGSTCRYTIYPDRHELRLEAGEGGNCRFFMLMTHLCAVYAPTLMGVPPLVVRSVECDAQHVFAVYEPLEDTAPQGRDAHASELPLSTVLASLEALGDVAGRLRDGDIVVPTAHRAPVDQTLALSEAWGLTLTEARVALALAEGRSPKQVAADLGVALSTVRVHLKHAYAKTETAGQRELVARVHSWQLR